MQQLDPDDPRRPAVQIAASIRAAILSGELAAGSRLKAGDELARYFGVAKATVSSAMRILRDEGYITSRAGSGTYVAEEASLPVPADADHPLAGAAAFLFEMGKLKVLPRSGWFHLGITRPEDVAGHSFRTAMVGMLLAAESGADPARTAALCLVHDTQETRTGDIDAIGRGYVTVHDAEAVTARQVTGLPDDGAKLIAGLVAEYEAGETIEAQLAHDADKLELILQADEYADQGYDTGPWRDAALPTLKTDAAKQLARAINATPPATWYLGHRSAYERRWLRRPGNDAYLSES
jgi:5'-deoxynucleotidase YfbR-like HD superfamily hydrolase/DNA-binding transcriptional regulator YhcF (GntR family)